MNTVITRQSQAIPHILYRNSAGGVVLNGDGKMVIVLQRNGVWSLPKGQSEEGEKHVDTARREIREECGVVDLAYVALLGSYTRYALDDSGREDRTRLRRITVFLFTTNETDLCPADPRIREARWVTPDEAIAMLGAPKDQEFLASVRNRL